MCCCESTVVFQHVEDGHRAGNDQALTCFNTVDASYNVDSICAEHRQHPHVDVV